jgi:hypothetical protein
MLRHMPSRIGLLSAVLLLFCGTLAFAHVNTWSSSGPPGGHFTFLKASSTEANVYYAAYNRSLHKSSDGGDTWTRIRDFTSQVNSLIVDPSDGRRIFVVSMDEGLFRSDDGGASFTRIALSASGIWGVGLSGTTLYYSTNARQVFRSPDLGATWSATPAMSPQVLALILVDPADSNSVFGFTSNFLVRSTNGGASWTQSSTTGSLNDVALIAPNTFIGAGHDGIYRSTDNGVQWTRVQANAFFRGIAIDPNVPGGAIAAAGVHTPRAPIYRTDDFGATWRAIGVAPNGPGEGVAITSGSASRILLVNSTGARYSLDNGITWVEAARPPIASTSQLTTIAAPNSKVYAFTSGIIGGSTALYSTSGDSGWTRLNLAAASDQAGTAFGQTAMAVRPGAPNTLYLAPFNSGFFRSTDGGNNWTRLGTGLGGHIVTAFAIDPTSADTMYAKMSNALSTPASALYRSLDGGQTWSPMTTTLPIGAYGITLIIAPSNSARMFMPAPTFGGINGALHASVDSGVNWSTPLTNQDVHEVAVDPADANLVYVASSTGLQVSSDGGATFTPNAAFAATTNRGASSVVVDPEIPTTLYAASAASAFPSGPHVLRSIDRGQTWEVLRDPNAAPWWLAADRLTLDPNIPGIVYVNTYVHGVATFEVAPELSLALSGHSGRKLIGAPASFSLRTQNAGPYAATAVKVVTTLPAGVVGLSASADNGSCSVAGTTVTCTRAVQAVGAVTNITVAYTPSVAMVLDLAPTVSAHERDPAPANNSAQASAIAGDITDLGVTLTPSATTLTNYESVGLPVVARNEGPDTISNATVTLAAGSQFTLGTLPQGCAMNGANAVCQTGSLAAGASRTFAFQATARAPGTATISAAIAPNETAVDLTAANNSAVASIAVRPLGDVVVTVTDSVDPATVNANFNYRIDVRNTGPDEMTNVGVNFTTTANISTVVATQGSCFRSGNAGTCNLASVPAGVTASITVTAAGGAPGTMSLQATATTDGADPTSSNNSAQENTTVNAAPASGGRGGGGGGALGAYLLLLLALVRVIRVIEHREFALLRRCVESLQDAREFVSALVDAAAQRTCRSLRTFAGTITIQRPERQQSNAILHREVQQLCRVAWLKDFASDIVASEHGRDADHLPKSWRPVSLQGRRPTARPIDDAGCVQPRWYTAPFDRWAAEQQPGRNSSPSHLTPRMSTPRSIAARIT